MTDLLLLRSVYFYTCYSALLGCMFAKQMCIKFQKTIAFCQINYIF